MLVKSRSRSRSRSLSYWQPRLQCIVSVAVIVDLLNLNASWVFKFNRLCCFWGYQWVGLVVGLVVISASGLSLRVEDLCSFLIYPSDV